MKCNPTFKPGLVRALRLNTCLMRPMARYQLSVVPPPDYHDVSLSLTLRVFGSHQGFYVSLDVSKLTDGATLIGRGMSSKRKDAEKLVP